MSKKDKILEIVGWLVCIFVVGSFLFGFFTVIERTAEDARIQRKVLFENWCKQTGNVKNLTQNEFYNLKKNDLLTTIEIKP